MSANAPKPYLSAIYILSKMTRFPVTYYYYYYYHDYERNFHSPSRPSINQSVIGYYYGHRLALTFTAVLTASSQRVFTNQPTSLPPLRMKNERQEQEQHVIVFLG
jgi:hypothetical protein